MGSPTKSWTQLLLGFPVCGLLLASGLASDLARADVPLRVRATLTELPRAPSCAGRAVRVLARYRLERVLSGALPPAADDPGRPLSGSLLVMHRCPELPRGTLPAGHGTALSLRPGQRHDLELRPYQGKLDAAPENAAAPYFEASLTDPAPDPPRISVVVVGPSDSQVRLDFDQTKVAVGSAADSDVRLNSPDVAGEQLRLEARPDKLVVIDLRPGKVRLNGRKLRGPTAITHKDSITVGPYSLRVSIFQAGEVSDDD